MKARDYAQQLVEAWLDGKPTSPIEDAIPEDINLLARRQARVVIEIIQHHGKAYLRNRAHWDTMPASIRVQVYRYADRKRREREALA
ncbi:MAG: hypothetical protein ACK2U9_21175 [Anaerolineae bacterium]